MTPDQLIRLARETAGKLSIASADPSRTVELLHPTALTMTRLLLEMSDTLALACGNVQVVNTDNATIKVGRALERAEIVRLLQQRADEAAASAGTYACPGSKRAMCANAAAATLETAAAEVKRRGQP